MIEPTLQEERNVAVVTLYETEREREEVSSIEAAVDIVKRKQSTDSVCEKIVAKDGTVVYNSDKNGNIEHWESEWKLQLRSLSSTEPTHRCPYQNTGCIGDDLCVECGIDKQIEQYSLNGDKGD